MKPRNGKGRHAIWLLLVLLGGCAPWGTPSPTAWLPTTPSLVPPSSEPAPAPSPLPSRPPASELGLLRHWRAEAGDIVWALGTTDVEADGQAEVWAASWDYRLYLYDSAGQERWSYRTDAPVYTALAADLGGDGLPEFVLGGDSGTLDAVDGQAAPLWSVALRGRVTHLAAGDLEGDGRLEIVAATWDGVLHVVDGGGSVVEQRSLEARPTALSLADLDGDAAAEVVVGVADGRLLALGTAGQVLWEHGLGDEVRALHVADLDDDGVLEVLAGSREGMIAVIEADGEPRWARRVEGTLLSMAPFAPAGLVLLGLRDQVVGLGLADGLPQWEASTEQGVWAFGFVGSGPDPVIAAGTDGGQVLLFDRRGQLRGEMQLPARVHGLLGQDLDRDGRPELLARSGDFVYALHTASGGEAGEAAPSVPTMSFWPDPSPLPAAEGRVSLLVVGDILLSRSVEERMRGCGVAYPFEVLAPLLQEGDLVLGNLEGVLAEGGEPADKPYLLRGHPDLAAGLAWAGVDLVNLANDHALDFGAEGLEETLEALQSEGIRPLGAGPQAAEPVVVTVEGLQIALLARNAVGSPSPLLAGVEDEETLREDVREAAQRADVVVLLLHAGQTFAAEPTEEQRRLARAAVQEGADLVVGFQSHIVQETEQVDAGFIAYGLGDFVADIDMVDEDKDGAVLRAVLGSEGVVRVDWVSARIVDDVQPRPVAAPGGRIAWRSLLVEVGEALPSPPSPRPVVYLSAVVDPLAGTVEVQQQVGFPNTTGDTLEELVFSVFPRAFSDTFALQQVEVLYGEETFAPSYTLAETILRLFLPRPILPGEAVTVRMRYALALPVWQEQEWPPAAYLGRDPNGRVVQLGHWYPQLVPYQRGLGWQTWTYHPVGDPFVAEMADYWVELQVPPDYRVFAGGERQPDTERWTFRLDAARDFAALIGRSYGEVTAEVDGVTLMAGYRLEHAEGNQQILREAQQALSFFEERLGPYPYSSFTLVEGDVLGGLEAGGMAVLGTLFYRGEDQVSPAMRQVQLAHQVAHQWWYNLVGNDQVYEPWLDEALACYGEMLFLEAFEPESLGWWWEERVGGWDPEMPVNASIYEFDDPVAYQRDVCGRGARFLQDVRQRVGGEAFLIFLQRYYRENAYQRVSRRDFFRSLEQETGHTVDDLVQIFFQP